MLALLAVLAGAAPAPAPSAPDTVFFAGGCFWGVEGIFEHVNGVLAVRSGYAGGTTVNPTSAQVYGGGTGHAESVEVIFDPDRVSYRQLLMVFFLVAHDPTQLNRQGPDVGTDYRSIAFYRDTTERQAIEAMIADLREKHLYAAPIVTEVVPLRAFYAAEDVHQHYMEHHLDDAYIVTNDLPRLDALRKEFPSLYRPGWRG